MSDESFKRFIENRTVADIMEDYGEQRDEWETLLSIEDGKVRRFRHGNGKVFSVNNWKIMLSMKKLQVFLKEKL